MITLAARLERLGPGGRKCPCCNEFHGKSKSKLTRIIRSRLKAHFSKEIHSEMTPE